MNEPALPTQRKWRGLDQGDPHGDRKMRPWGPLLNQDSPFSNLFDDNKSPVQFHGHCLPETHLLRVKLEDRTSHGGHHGRVLIGPTKHVVLMDQDLTRSAVDQGPIWKLGIRHLQKAKVGLFLGIRKVAWRLLQQKGSQVDRVLVECSGWRDFPIAVSASHAVHLFTVGLENFFNDFAPPPTGKFRFGEIGIFEQVHRRQPNRQGVPEMATPIRFLMASR